ncbi:hypothetical protein B0O80DRAFT_504229 [Mortierella sp. GBAus27b]|nr:hypothetical protein B0O80DRAFT_504229 [Mortierella sp. GBAus27b]
MEIHVPTLTPRNYRPRGDLSRLSNLHVPHLDYKTQFFLDVRPEFWTYEGFLQQTPGSRDDFLYDLDLLGKATTHGPDARQMRIHSGLGVEGQEQEQQQELQFHLQQLIQLLEDKEEPQQQQ